MRPAINFLSLAAALGAGFAAPAAAQSVSSSTINGLSITVIGASSSAIMSINGRTEIRVDGEVIRFADGVVEFDGASIDAGDISALQVSVEEGEIRLRADGRELSAAADPDLPQPLPGKRTATGGPPPLFWYEKDGAPAGPVPLAALRAMRAEGGIDADTLIWRKGMTDWEAAGAVLGD